MKLYVKVMSCMWVVLILFSWNAYAKDKISHLGVPATDIVLLKGVDFAWTPPAGPPGFLVPDNFSPQVFTRRILPGGTVVDDYQVPAGKLLVITDINWGWDSDGSSSVYCLILRLADSEPIVVDGEVSSDPSTFVHQSCMHPSEFGSGGSGIGNVVEQFTSGIVVRNNQLLYTLGPWEPISGGGDPAGGTYLGGTDFGVLLQGYLIDE